MKKRHPERSAVFFVIFAYMKKILILVAALCLASTAFAQQYGIVDISVCNLRDTPNYSAEMVSQALLGMPVRILSNAPDNGWPQVETPDGYTGWVHKDAISRKSVEEMHDWLTSPQVVVTVMTGVVYEEPRFAGPVISDIVSGDRFKFLGREYGYYHVAFPDGREGYIPTIHAKPLDKWRDSISTSADAIIESALKLKGYPYLWGGTSVKGMDCSGFVRTVFFMHDLILPRDAGPQSRVGSRIEGINALEKGDLVFFGRKNADGSARVSHVGIYIGDGRFIHSLGLVKIGSFCKDDPLYDSYNTGRYLFAVRILSYLDAPEVSTTVTNPLYNL